MTIARPSAAERVAAMPGRAAQAAARSPALTLSRVEPACWLLLAAGVLLGGSSFFSWRDGVLALLALPVLLLALWPRQHAADALGVPAGAALALSLLPLLWLVPLPAAWIAALPGRAGLLQPALAELGADAWLP
ncbi:MAG TPA: hypothetical protein VLF18_20565, partial [Tahibacter sp.]|uniref:hypothetical protein n=1 Tax=Tahibacter sp. TaxID=2056211 RepID=UPI002BC0C056